MVGNIIHKGNNAKEYPLVLTEAEFLEILNKGIYTYNLLGHQVALSNSQATSGTNLNYMIVDLNHDSNQLNTYDLMAVDTVAQRAFGNSNYWRNSGIRTWLNGTYISGFSASIQSHIINMRYNSNGTIYTDDKIIMPSITEITGDKYDSSYTKNEGTLYPVVPAYIRKYTNSSYQWMTRTCDSGAVYLWGINNLGSLWVNGNSYNTSNCVVPLFRVQ